MRACYRQFNTCMLHLFCKVNPPTYISTRDRPRYWPGAGVSRKRAPGIGYTFSKFSKLLARGRCFSKESARDWIAILKARLLARGRCFSKEESVREEKGRAQRQDRGRCFSKESVRFGTKAGLKPVHAGIGNPMPLVGPR